VLNRDQSKDGSANARMAQDLISAYANMVAKARAKGIKAIGATILPYSGSAYYHPPAEAEAARQTVNAWIRAPGNFDAVIDWDAALRDPARPTHLLPAYDNDGLHPNLAGYKAMADAIPLSLFESP
jgi:lysophospholipase L1-like esterase